MQTRVRINGQELHTTDPKEILSQALTRPDLQYWSLEALRELFFGSIDFLEEFCYSRREGVRRDCSQEV